jgi:hypothetical protein
MHGSAPTEASVPRRPGVGATARCATHFQPILRLGPNEADHPWKGCDWRANCDDFGADWCS